MSTPAPCPFCASTDIREWFQDRPKLLPDRYSKVCNGCGAIGPQADTPAEAEQVWAKRAKT